MPNQYSYIKVAALTPKINIANPIKNAKQLIEILKNNKNISNIDLLALPELYLTGYTCADLFHRYKLLEDAKDALKLLLDFTEENFVKKVIVVGVPLQIGNKLYNTAVAIQEGHILGIVPKQTLPNYNEFYEKRWFNEGYKIDVDSIYLFDEEVEVGINLLFNDKYNDNFIFGIEICEDLWAPIPPSCYLSLKGASLIVNLSASNWVVSKRNYRRELVANQSARCISAYLYVSTGYGESTTDTVFDGHSIIAENGKILSETQAQLSEEHQLIVSEIDLEHIIYDRMHNNAFALNSFYNLENKPIKIIYFDSPEWDKELSVKPDKTPFVPKATEDIKERCLEIINIQSNALAHRFIASKSESMVIGLSGGLDSTLALLVIVNSLKLLKQAKNKCIAITMPGFGTSDKTKSNVVRLCEALDVKLTEIPINDISLMHLNQLNHPDDIYDVTYENVQARIRTLVLMNMANQTNGLVIGTGDMSELALGWATYNGDHMSMYNVNCGVPKTLIRYIVDAASKQLEVFKSAKDVLQDILKTPVSPELLPLKDGNIEQKTEEILGPYEVHDFILYHFLRYGTSPKKILWLIEQSYKDVYSREQLNSWVKLFFKRFFSQQFKRSCIPDGPKIGSVSLSPRADWRMPSDANYSSWIDDLDN